jgi:hypothetical protein
MRTTVNIADHLLIEARRLSAARRTSLAKLMEDSLRKYLAEVRDEEDRAPPDLAIAVVHSGPPVPGIDLNDTSALLEL